MEEVLNKMVATVIGYESKSNYEDMYKNWGRLGGQEERRRELLETQKHNRNTKLDACRGILGLINSIEERDIFQSKRKVYYRPNIYVAGFNKAPLSYNNVLMTSEWMIEKPKDFENEWYVVPCPKGARMLVISTQGRTKCYSKHGQFRFQIRSLLPGGRFVDKNVRSPICCVMDCFYSEHNSTMYVLDFLAWNNQPMTDCDTEFRQFWLKSQFAEHPEFSLITKSNDLKFVLLPKEPSSPEELNKFMNKHPHFEDGTPLDGILFYHKKAHYVSGETPLVGWLFPYMVQEVLGKNITVHESYMAEKPEDYINQEEFIKVFEQRMAMKKNRWRRSSRTYCMDTAYSTDTDEYKNMEADEIEDSAHGDEDVSDDVDDASSDVDDASSDASSTEVKDTERFSNDTIEVVAGENCVENVDVD